MDGSFPYHLLLNTPFSKNDNAFSSRIPAHTVDDPAELDVENLDFLGSWPDVLKTSTNR